LSSIKIVDESFSALLTDKNSDALFGGRKTKVWTVSEWLNQTRLYLEGYYGTFWVRGEISALTQAASGHCYFVLKEGSAQLRCVLFRQYAQRLSLKLVNGLEVEACVQSTIYEERGDLQLRVESLRAVGQGDSWQQFLLLKQKLEAKGYFAAERKKPLPAYPRSIGVITSLQAAALKDVIAALRKRAPSVRLIIYPAAVQGELAEGELANALGLADARAEVDLLILCRGGGSLEDLAAFNTVGVAEALVASRLPVISGVGHETDFTIADFVADLRAPTPTAAVMLAVPDERELRDRLVYQAQRLLKQGQHRLEREQRTIDYFSQRLKNPYERLQYDRQRLMHARQRFQGIKAQLMPTLWHRLALYQQRLSTCKILPMPDALHQRAHRLKQAMEQLWAQQYQQYVQLERRYRLSHPKAPLRKGYAMVMTPLPEQKVISSVKGVAVGQELRVLLEDGIMHVVVQTLTQIDSME
jgi:exodeoxyribonuclease VII large subunit